jgi:hypothetical protein
VNPPLTCCSAAPFPRTVDISRPIRSAVSVASRRAVPIGSGHPSSWVSAGSGLQRIPSAARETYSGTVVVFGVGVDPFVGGLLGTEGAE